MNETIMNEDVVTEATEEIVTTNSGKAGKVLLAIGGLALIYVGGRKLFKLVKAKKAAKAESKCDKKGETFHSEIFDEDVEVSDVEETK